MPRGKGPWDRSEEAYQEPVDIDEVEVEFEEPEHHVSIVQPERDPLIVWSVKTGLPPEFWQSLGVRSEGGKYISFNWSEGWKKIRDVTLRLDVKTNEIDPSTKKPRIRRRFWWKVQPPNTVKPLWPEPSESAHEEIWLCEGESDCGVLRYLGFDAYTFGAATNIPGDIELRMLDLMGVKRAILVFDADHAGRTAAEKMSVVLSEFNEIDVLIVDLGKILRRWKYVKDIRDVFGRLPETDVKNLLMKTREKMLEEREDDISADVLVQTATNPEWVWDGLFGKAALNLLFGAAKVGKTELTYHFIKASSGEDDSHLLHRKVSPQRILYYSEMPASFDKQRMEVICGGAPPNLWIRNSTHRVFEGMTWPAVVLQMERDCAKYQIDYVIIDTVIEWFKFSSEEMYDAGVVGDKLRLLRKLTSKGITVQINHHPPKAGGSPFGSIAFQGYVDCLVEMERDDQGTTLSAKGRLRSDFSSVKYAYADSEGKELAVLQIDDKSDRASSEAQIAGVKSRILALLPYKPGHMTLAQLKEKDELLEKSGKQLPTRMAELVKADLVGKIDTDPAAYYRTFSVPVPGVVVEKVEGNDRTKQ